MKFIYEGLGLGSDGELVGIKEILYRIMCTYVAQSYY